MHVGLNLCVLSEIYESETWDRQVDGSLHYMYIPIANIIRGSMTVGHENLNITF